MSFDIEARERADDAERRLAGALEDLWRGAGAFRGKVKTTGGEVLWEVADRDKGCRIVRVPGWPPVPGAIDKAKE